MCCVAYIKKDGSYEKRLRNYLDNIIKPMLSFKYDDNFNCTCRLNELGIKKYPSLKNVSFDYNQLERCFFELEGIVNPLDLLK